MPQFIDDNGNFLAYWADMYTEDGGLIEYSNFSLIQDKDYSLDIAPLREAAPDEFDSQTIQSRINEFINAAETESLRILARYGVTQDDLGLPVVLKVNQNGEIPYGVYAASRIYELVKHINFTDEDVYIYSAHSLAMIVQYAFGDRDFLKKDLKKFCITQGEKGAMKRGAEGDLKHAIRKICIFIGSTAWPKFKEVIKDRDKIRHLYEARTDRINIHDFKLEGDRLLFQSRDVGEDSRAIGTIKNILSEINL